MTERNGTTEVKAGGDKEVIIPPLEAMAVCYRCPDGDGWGMGVYPVNSGPALSRKLLGFTSKCHGLTNGDFNADTRREAQFCNSAIPVK